MSEYETKKRFYDDVMTFYGRKPVLELLGNPNTVIHRLHLANSNKQADIIRQIESLADSRHIEIVRHSKESLSRISKNARQDQGVAIDVRPARYRSIEALPPQGEFLALDRITNSQNLGMIIRSVAASPLSGLILPKTGCARIDALVMKASAGTLLDADIFYCGSIGPGLSAIKSQGVEILGLDADGDLRLPQIEPAEGRRIYALGNETDGLSAEVRSLCDNTLCIPIAGNVESLNVVAAATLVAFNGLYRRRG